MDDFAGGVQILEFQGRVFPLKILKIEVWSIVNDVLEGNSLPVPVWNTFFAGRNRAIPSFNGLQLSIIQVQTSDLM